MNNYNYYQNAYMGYPQGNNMQGYGQRPYPNQQAFVQQPQETQIPIVDIKFVSQKKEAEDFIVFPNTAVLLIDNINGFAYLKLSNGNAQSHIREFSFVEKGKEQKPLNAPKSKENENVEQFVKKEDLERLNLVSMAQYREDYNKLVESFSLKLKELSNKIGEFANGKQITE